MPKRSFTKPRTVDAKQNKEIKKLKQQVKTLVKTNEIKHLNTKFNDVEVNAYALGSFSRGLTDVEPWQSNASGANATKLTQREGDAILIKRIKIKAMLTLPQNGPDATFDTIVRVLIVHWPQGGNESMNEVLYNTGTIFSLLQNYPTTPYKVLYDKSFNLQTQTQPADSGQPTGVIACPVEPFRRNLNISLGAKQFGKKGIRCFWAGSTALDPAQGAITMYAYSDQSNVAGTSPYISGTARLSYMDN
jgi:hypothetical protein